MITQERTIFLTGGAGYIGSCLAAHLGNLGYHPIILDNFSTSLRNNETNFPVKEVDLTDPLALKIVWNELPSPGAVIHLAAKALVGESVTHPENYFRNNINAALNVAELASQTKGCVFVHSSSCAIYGIPETLPIQESSPKNPISPYGMSKWMVEQMLDQFREWRKLPLAHLRYFNPSGAMTHKGIWYGESHVPETHLIPLVIQNAQTTGKIPVFGTDYPTPDGTCIRDFIHIEDLCEAHRLALEHLRQNPSQNESFNLGFGKGISVKEVVTTTSQVLGKPLQIEPLKRRLGDPPVLFADNRMAKQILGWSPKHSLESMIQSHLSWIEKSLNLSDGRKK